MHTIKWLSLPTTVLRSVQGGIVHGQPSAIPDIITHSHVMEVPIGHSGPHAGQSLAPGDGCAEEVASRVPITEVAAHGHIEDPAEIGSLVIIRGSNIGSPDAGAGSAGIGPQVAVPVHEHVERCSISVGVVQAVRPNQRPHVAES